MDYTFRKAEESDFDYLLQIRRLTMDDYLLQNGLDISDKEHTFRIKYNFDDAKIILEDGVEVGLFKASYTAQNSQWYIYQIQIHPDYQGLGIGRKLIVNLCEQALKDNSSVGLSVLKSNPVKRLYDRLGFTVIDSNSSGFEMVFNA